MTILSNAMSEWSIAVSGLSHAVSGLTRERSNVRTNGRQLSGSIRALWCGLQFDALVKDELLPCIQVLQLQLQHKRNTPV